ncbi:MAG: VWA domain-containing protein [Acidobacteriota bacterium]|jgi:VWFA-related protein|nr:VWA domain-containing protein [Acidobacteriota bacterium]
MLLRSIRPVTVILFIGVLLLVGFSGIFSGASSAAQLPQGVSKPTVTITVDLVNVLCSVFDKRTKTFVTSLGQGDFSIFEDGKRQEIRNFTRETDLPLTLAMLVDTSNTVKQKLEFEQDAATSFFANVLKEKDRALLVEFNTSVALLQDFTSDPNKLANQIRKLHVGGDTALYDAIHTVCDQKMIRENGRKAMIILSDGEDTVSSIDYKRAVEMAVRAECTIFAVSINKGGFFGTGEDTKKGDNTLKNLARETGGKVFFPFKVEELEEAFRQINQELRSQYSVGYVSTNSRRDGSHRKIEIKVPAGGLELNYRKGYYAPSN